MTNTPTKHPTPPPPPTRGPSAVEHAASQPTPKIELPVPPPQNNMASEPEKIDESTLPPSTVAEMAAGREGLKNWEARDKAEHDAGKKALKERADTHPAAKDGDKDDLL